MIKLIALKFFKKRRLESFTGTITIQTEQKFFFFKHSNLSLIIFRRSAATRTRCIYSIKGERVDEDPHLLKIKLSTEAGTYIKEFVHGDFGRTYPSLSDILEDCRTDIIELDVEVGFDLPEE